MADTPLPKYQCARCNTLHDSELIATECCPTTVWDVWECEICGKVYEDKSEVVECCADTSENEAERERARIEALERAGQTRLFA